MLTFSNLFLAVWAAAAPTPHLMAPEQLAKLALDSNSQVYPVKVPSCATFGQRLVHVLLRQVSGTAKLGNLLVTYADQQTQSLPLGRSLKPGEETPWLELGVKGFQDSRCVSSLQVEAAADGTSPSEVLVMGQSENGAAVIRP